MTVGSLVSAGFKCELRCWFLLNFPLLFVWLCLAFSD